MLSTCLLQPKKSSKQENDGDKVARWWLIRDSDGEVAVSFCCLIACWSIRGRFPGGEGVFVLNKLGFKHKCGMYAPETAVVKL